MSQSTSHSQLEKAMTLECSRTSTEPREKLSKSMLLRPPSYSMKASKMTYQASTGGRSLTIFSMLTTEKRLSSITTTIRHSMSLTQKLNIPPSTDATRSKKRWKRLLHISMMCGLANGLLPPTAVLTGLMDSKMEETSHSTSARQLIAQKATSLRSMPSTLTEPPIC